MSVLTPREKRERFLHEPEGALLWLSLLNDPLGRKDWLDGKFTFKQHDGTPILDYSAPWPDYVEPKGERLECVGIVRNVEVYGRASKFRSHWELRAALKPWQKDYRRGEPGDIDGFITTTGRFLNRREAQDFAINSGQLKRALGREMLSSDLNW